MSTHIDLVGLARGEHNATRDAARNLRDMFAGSLEAFRTHYGLKRRCDAMANLIGFAHTVGIITGNARRDYLQA